MQKLTASAELVDSHQEQLLVTLQQEDYSQNVTAFRSILARCGGDVQAAEAFVALFTCDRVGDSPDEDAFLWRASEALDPRNVKEVVSIDMHSRSGSSLIGNQYGNLVTRQFLRFADRNPDRVEVIGENFGEIALELKQAHIADGGASKLALGGIKQVLKEASVDSSLVIPGINGSAQHAAGLALGSFGVLGYS